MNVTDARKSIHKQKNILEAGKEYILGSQHTEPQPGFSVQLGLLCLSRSRARQPTPSVLMVLKQSSPSLFMQHETYIKVLILLTKPKQTDGVERWKQKKQNYYLVNRKIPITRYLQAINKLHSKGIG